MAADTAAIVTLEARDWELLMFLVNGIEGELEEIKFSLQEYFKAAPAGSKPRNQDLVPVVTTEGAVFEVFRRLQGFSARNITKDIGTNTPYKRILTHLRTLNNIADNYLLTRMTAEDDAMAAILLDRRIAGRK